MWKSPKSVWSSVLFTNLSCILEVPRSVMFLHPSGWMMMIVFHSHEIRSSWGRFLLPSVFPWHLCTDLRILGINLCGGFTRASMGSTGWWIHIFDVPFHARRPSHSSMVQWKRFSALVKEIILKEAIFLPEWWNDGRVTEKVILPVTLPLKPHTLETPLPPRPLRKASSTQVRAGLCWILIGLGTQNDRWKKLTERSKSTKKNVKFSVL